MRDRIAVAPDDLAALTESLRARGQQTPIEVVDLGGGQYGLISGWRRISALRALLDETGEAQFATVLALLRQPADASAAYVAMVEENEIRIGLSYYERARLWPARWIRVYLLLESKHCRACFLPQAAPNARKSVPFLHWCPHWTEPCAFRR